MPSGRKSFGRGALALSLLLVAAVAALALAAWAPLLPYFRPALAPVAMALPPIGIFLTIALLTALACIASARRRRDRQA